jgi:hypothetical protein
MSFHTARVNRVISDPSPDVRFTPDSDRRVDIAGGPRNAINRHGLLFDHSIGPGQ